MQGGREGRREAVREGERDLETLETNYILKKIPFPQIQNVEL